MCTATLSPFIQEDPFINSFRIPVSYHRNKDIMGVFMYLVRYHNLGNDNWEDVARKFLFEQTGVQTEGRGSTKTACRYIQSNWSIFKSWIAENYPKKILL